MFLAAEYIAYSDLRIWNVDRVKLQWAMLTRQVDSPAWTMTGIVPSEVRPLV